MEDQIIELDGPITTKNELVVLCHGVWKSYKSFGKNKHIVLKNLNLRLHNRTIYGLLGPSGCGKTTLLKCILGRTSVDEGTIKVFGHRPGSAESGIPGPIVGYMPQEQAVYDELTASEICTFFGKLYGMGQSDIRERIEFLFKLLKLEHQKNVLTSNLSGGQKRRVSFALALIHQPELLILDEPTVGLDPLLRQSIWKYLYKLTEENGVAVIITTHYIEEARMAHKVGMMMSGHLLAEDDPEVLIAKYNCKILEEVFLNLCIEEGGDEIIDDFKDQKSVLDNDKLPEHGQKSAKLTDKNSLVKREDDESMAIFTSPRRRHFGGNKMALFYRRLIALIQKCFLVNFRFPSAALGQLISPALTFMVFSIAIGKDLQRVQIGVVNSDAYSLGDLFLSRLDTNKVSQVPYDNYDNAYQGLKDGQIWGLIYIRENFSDALLTRLIHGVLSDKETFIQSTISVPLDWSNIIVSLQLRYLTYATMEKFLADLVTRIGLSQEVASLPLSFEDSVYGTEETQFAQFLLPGFMICTTFFTSLGITTVLFEIERSIGTWGRIVMAELLLLVIAIIIYIITEFSPYIYETTSLVCISHGVAPWEVIASYTIVQISFISVQTILIFVMVFAIFGFTCNGSIVLAALMLILQGSSGVTLGLLIASATADLIFAVVTCLVYYFAVLLLEGIVWPLPASPVIIGYISRAMPHGQSCESLGNIFIKGWGLDHFDVSSGFLLTFIWTGIFIVFAFLFMRKSF